ncbi:hypothetical protein HMPREF9622_00950 [Cutibacterium modestum HL037PA3]|uniref:Uncharacterized protein n=1 Tax=Cutibacterium modestum HL044PA1 TaxID=765109 RepID=A0ABP2K451_9ACTN|nr:hypothetical protein HMPREF9621_00566 [Cutibacterium modestum HL037PA2]EFS91592.1 hypothetical protein HMPREF9607_02099 [Cutibacterium modestum HL044PA1]EFT16090.1 hypothetical protein HMPREF9622_00950 [Cutibacterium modestum HL037PA3]EGG26995.1 hypothetical protein PA08_1234 [Cutibacterium modestum P08]
MSTPDLPPQSSLVVTVHTDEASGRPKHRISADCHVGNQR